MTTWSTPRPMASPSSPSMNCVRWFTPDGRAKVKVTLPLTSRYSARSASTLPVGVDERVGANTARRAATQRAVSEGRLARMDGSRRGCRASGGEGAARPVGAGAEPGRQPGPAEPQGQVRGATEGDRQPEVDQSPAEDAGRGDAGLNPEALQHRDDRQFDHAEAARRQWDDGEDVGKAVRNEHVDR